MSKKAKTGNELRDRSWSLINRSVLDLPPRFVSDMSGGRPITTTAINGLIRTQKGYYRLAEDTRDGTRILLHAYERDQLAGEKQRDRAGTVLIKSMDADKMHIYGVSARKDVAGGVFRDDLNHDMRYLEHAFQKDLNLHTSSLAVDDSQSNKKKQIVKFANGRGAFGIFEADAGKWRVRYYRNLKRGQDPAERFTSVEEAAPHNPVTKLFSLGRDVQEFKTYPEALKYVRQEWAKMAFQIYEGKPVEYESSDMRIRILAHVLDFLDERKYRDWVVAGVIGAAVGGVTEHFAHGVKLWEAFTAAAGSSAWVAGGRQVENFLYEKYIKHVALESNRKMEHLRPYFEQNAIEDYLLQTPENEIRFRRKIDPRVLRHLRLLNHEEADMNYDSGDFTPNNNPQRPIEDLSSTAFRYFGAIFDSSEYEHGLLASAYPNGLITLTQVDPKTHATRHYLTLRREFNEQTAIGVKLPETGIERLPSAGPVHKITHKQGRMFGYVGMTPEEFLGDLMQKIGPEAKTMRFFGLPIAELFNVKAPERVRALTKDSQTLDEINAKKELDAAAYSGASIAPV